MADEWQNSLQAELDQLKKDHAALQSELKAEPESNQSNAQAVKRGLVTQVPTYLQQIHELALFGDSESVRLAASKTLVEWALTNKLDPDSAEADDEFKDLLKKIRTKAAQHDAKQKEKEQ